MNRSILAAGLCLTVCACADAPPPESPPDLIGPRTTRLKSDAAFEVCLIADEQNLSTVEHAGSLPGDTLHLMQPALLSVTDIGEVIIEEAPAQKPTLTLTLTPEAAERISAATRGPFAAIINNQIVSGGFIRMINRHTLQVSTGIDGPDLKSIVQ